MAFRRVRVCRRAPRRSTVVLPYNDTPALLALFAREGERIAAIIVEPIAGNMGVVEPDRAFLEAVRGVTSEFGALFICDEVITGFRVAYGGAQELLDLRPDITTLGKIIGGGLPVGAYGGPRALMEHMAPSGPVYQAGTLAGNPLAMAAGLASLEGLRRDGFYSALGDTTESLRAVLTGAAHAAGVPVRVNAVPGMLTVFFTPDEVRDLAGAQRANTALYARFFHAMLRRGVYLPPSQFEAWMVSPVHSDVIESEIGAIAAEAFREVGAAA